MADETRSTENTNLQTNPKFDKTERAELIKNALAGHDDYHFECNTETVNLFEGVQDPLVEVKMTAKCGVLFKSFNDLGDWEKIFITTTINYSHFEDEMKENNVPLLTEKQLKKYDILFQRNFMTLPGYTVDDFSCQMLTDYEFLAQTCRDTGVNTWALDSYEQRNDVTCRWSLDVIPRLWTATCQWEMSELEEEERSIISKLSGDWQCDRTFMLERTKQDIHQPHDSMLKCRVFMNFKQTDDGVVIDFLWFCVCNFGWLTRPGILLAYQAIDTIEELTKCFRLLRKQWLEWRLEQCITLKKDSSSSENVGDNADKVTNEEEESRTLT